MKRSVVIRRILLVALLGAFLILKFYESSPKENNLKTEEVTTTVVEAVQSIDSTDTLWFSHLSMATIDKTPKYLNWRTPKLLEKGEIGFEFYRGAVYRKLEKGLNGKIKSLGIFASIGGLPVDFVDDEISAKPDFNYKLIDGYEDRDFEESRVFIYHDTKNQSIIELHYFKNNNNFKIAKVYTNTSHNVFGKPGDENLLFTAVNWGNKKYVVKRSAK